MWLFIKWPHRGFTSHVHELVMVLFAKEKKSDKDIQQLIS